MSDEKYNNEKRTRRYKIKMKLLENEYNKVRSLNQIRQKVMEKYIGKKNTKGLTPRHENYIDPHKKLVFGSGRSTKLTQHDRFDHELLTNNPLSVSQNNGMELSLESIQNYKWKTVRLVNNFTINILCSLRVTDEILNKSENMSIVQYLYTLIAYVHKHIKDHTVYDLSMKQFYITVNKIIDYLKNGNYIETTDKMKKSRQKLKDKFDAFLNIKDTGILYKNVILIYVKNTKISQLTSYDKTNDSSSSNRKIYIKLYNRMVKAYEKLNMELSDYEPMLRMSESETIENKDLILCMQEIAERYRPSPELEIFSDAEESVLKMRKFEKKELNSIKMGKKWINDNQVVDSDENHSENNITIYSDSEDDRISTNSLIIVPDVTEYKKHKSFTELNEIKKSLEYDFNRYEPDYKIDGFLRMSELKLMIDPLYLLSDLIINAYGKVIMEDYPEYYVTDTFLISQWRTNSTISQNQINRIKYKTRKLVFIPLHVNSNHWTLCAVSPSERYLKYYDSLHLYREDDTSPIPYKNHITNFLASVDPGINYSFTRVPCPQQNNGSDCGVFVCAFIEKLITEKNVNSIRASNMQSIRYYVAYQISRLLPN